MVKYPYAMSLEGKTWMRRAVDKKAEDALAASPSPDSENGGPTIPEILHDDASSREFGQMLETKKDPRLLELGARLRSGTPEEADLKEAEKYREEFLNWKQRAETLNETIDTRFDELRGVCPDLDDACKAWGAENYKSVLKAGLAEMPFKDPAAFAKLEKNYLKVAASEKAIDDPENMYNKRLTEFCQKHRLDEDTVFETLSEQNFGRRKAEMQRVIRDQMVFLDRWVDNWRLWRGQPSSKTDAEMMSHLRDAQGRELAKHEALVRGAGGVLVSLVSKNPELRNALASARPGEGPKVKEGIASTASFAEVRERTFNRGDIRQKWVDSLNDWGINNFSAMSPLGQDAIRDRFAKQYVKNQMGGQKGFWAMVIEWLLGDKFKSDPRIKAQLT